MSYTLDTIEQGIATKREIAKLFWVHETFVYKVSRQKRERGDLTPCGDVFSFE